MGAGCSSDSGVPRASNFRLTYFNGKGRCETIRLCMAAGGIRYEDRRIEQTDWPGLKPHTPWGTLPVLDIDRWQLGQSMAIARFVAREAGLSGRNSFEQALIDSVTDQVTDLREKLGEVKFKPEAEKKAAFKDFSEKTIPTVLPNLEKFAASNTERGYFVGNKITLADIHFFAIMELVNGMIPNVLSSYPTLQKIYKNVANHPRIAAYLERRPQTAF
jgi:glutathione S-transferase